MIDKPTVFNYMRYMEALDEIERLRKQVANLEIKCRILEENQPEWIPVEKRLPENNDMFIVTRGTDGFEEEGTTSWAMFDKRKKKFYYLSSRIHFYIAVTAWMPFPDPWKGESEDE